MKLFAGFAFLALAALSTSCGKDDPASPTQTYFPLTAGSSWTYKETTTNTNYTFTVTGRDSVFLGKTYKVMSNSLGGNVYAAVVGDDYYRYGILPTQALTGSGVEEYYLKANAGVGGKWSQTTTISYQGSNYPLKFDYTLTSVGGTRTVAGKAYSNVALVTLNLGLTYTGINLNVGGGTFYYAAGIGLIESTLNIQPPTGAALNQNTQLQTYVIK